MLKTTLNLHVKTSFPKVFQQMTHVMSSATLPLKATKEVKCFLFFSQLLPCQILTGNVNVNKKAFALIFTCSLKPLSLLDIPRVMERHVA